jgi:putative flippase GtrA
LSSLWQSRTNQTKKEEDMMSKQILHLYRAASDKKGGRLFSFLCIGGFGAIVNVLCFSSAYYPLLKVANSFLAYGIAFIVGTEVSIVSNFILNDRFTFDDLYA